MPCGTSKVKQGGVNPGAEGSPPLCCAVLYSTLFSRPWPPASSKCDQSAVCLWWMGSLWLRGCMMGPGSGRERDTGSLGILCIAHALVHTETLSLCSLIIRAHGSTRGLQLDTIYTREQAMTTCACFGNLLCCESSASLVLGYTWLCSYANPILKNWGKTEQYKSSQTLLLTLVLEGQWTWTGIFRSRMCLLCFSFIVRRTVWFVSCPIVIGKGEMSCYFKVEIDNFPPSCV